MIILALLIAYCVSVACLLARIGEAERKRKAAFAAIFLSCPVVAFLCLGLLGIFKAVGFCDLSANAGAAVSECSLSGFDLTNQVSLVGWFGFLSVVFVPIWVVVFGLVFGVKRVCSLFTFRSSGN